MSQQYDLNESFSVEFHSKPDFYQECQVSRLSSSEDEECILEAAEINCDKKNTNNFDQLKSVNNKLRGNISKIFDLLNDKEIHMIQNEAITEILMSSILIETFKSRLNLNSIKLLKTSSSLSDKILEICEMKQSISNRPKALNYKDIFSGYGSANCQVSAPVSAKSVFNFTDPTIFNFSFKPFVEAIAEDQVIQQNRSSESFHDLILNYNENLAQIENILNEQISAVGDLENKNLDTFFLRLDKLLGENKREFSIDLSFLAFDFIIMADTILNMFEIQRTESSSQVENQVKPKASIQREASTKPTSQDEDLFIKFSSYSVNAAPTIVDFSQKIISLKISDILKNKSSFTRLTDNDKVACTNCKAFTSCFTHMEKNQWKCNFCKQSNQTKLFKLFTKHVEYVKPITIAPPVLNQVNLNKIIIFCIDISGSMSGHRLQTVKTACIATLDLLLTENPEYRVALVTFESGSIYYGHGDKNESTVSGLTSHVPDRIKSLADSILPIKSSYNLLVNRINALQSSGGTYICPALSQSVLIAAHTPNSEVIVCTDGCADDKNEQVYNSIVEFCKKNGNIKINIITFEDDGVNLILLGRLASETKGKIHKTSDAFKFQTFFSDVCKLSATNTQVGTVKVTVMGDYSWVSLDSKGYKLDLNDVDKNEKEIFIEWSSKVPPKNKGFLYFQIQIDSKESTIVLTTKVKCGVQNSIQNFDIVHAYSLRKLSNMVLKEKNLTKAKQYVTQYELFNEKYNQKCVDNVADTCKLIGDSFDCNFKDEDAMILHNNSTILSGDIVCNNTYQADETDIEKIVSLSELNNEKYEEIFAMTKTASTDFKEFETKLNEIFDSFYLNDLDLEINTKKLLTVMNLLKQAFYITHILVCVLGSNKDEETQANKLITQIETFFTAFKSNQTHKINDFKSLFYQIKLVFAEFKLIFNDLNSFKSSKQSDWQNCQEVLNKLLDFIDNSGNDKTQFGKMDHVAIKLVTKSKSYSSIVEEIESFGNRKFNAETKTSFSTTILKNSAASIQPRTAAKKSSGSKLYSGLFK